MGCEWLFSWQCRAYGSDEGVMYGRMVVKIGGKWLSHGSAVCMMITGK